MKKWLFAFAAMSLSVGTFAGGFQVALQGQKQIGMAHIGTPFKLDASSIYFNPGALPMLDKKMSFNVGISPIFSNAVYFNEEFNSTTEADNGVGTPLEAYGSYMITDKLAFGIGVYTPFGSGVNWGDDWDGQYLVRDIDLQAIFIQPTLAYQLTDKIGIGAGFIYSTGEVTLNRGLKLPVGNGSSDISLNGKATGFGGNFGVYMDVTEKIHVGITYKTKVAMKVEEGDAKFNNVPSGLSSSFPADNKFAATLNLPGSVNAGVAYDVNDKLSLALELNYVMWSAYDSLIFDFEENTSSLEDSHNPREYENTLAVRVGAQYELSDLLTPRVGFYYDPSPIGDKYFSPETPNCDNLGFSAGLSINAMENLSVDLSFLYIHGMERESNYEPSDFGGKYKTNAYIPGIGLTYQF
ncbi:MAG: OmpP1/FadL family transporter [Salibacteraceae bacterium]